MRISGLIEKLEKFKSTHGDISVDTDYWCEDCQDYHEGLGLELDLNSDGKMTISPITINF